MIVDCKVPMYGALEVLHKLFAGLDNSKLTVEWLLKIMCDSINEYETDVTGIFVTRLSDTLLAVTHGDNDLHTRLMNASIAVYGNIYLAILNIDMQLPIIALLPYGRDTLIIRINVDEYPVNEQNQYVHNKQQWLN